MNIESKQISRDKIIIYIIAFIHLVSTCSSEAGWKFSMMKSYSNNCYFLPIQLYKLLLLLLFLRSTESLISLQYGLFKYKLSLIIFLTFLNGINF